MSRDTVVVTYLGGPEDMTRRVHPRSDLNHGCWFLLSVRPHYSQDYLRSDVTTRQVPVDKCRYDFVPVRSHNGDEQWLAIYNERY
ncbi:hypothetical protein [Stenotrophomonas phage c9-N]|nr:hypothetical protein [Stenotrophomonas phage c9-N]